MILGDPFCNCVLPSIMAYATAEPMGRLMKIFLKPQYVEVMASSSGLKDILRPFVGFTLFCVGKIFTAIVALGFYIWLQGDSGKPFTVFFLISLTFLSSFGLQLFLVFEEYVFYTWCTAYKRVVNMLLETPKEKASDGNNEMQDTQNNRIQGVSGDLSTKTTLEETIEDLIDIMENMSKLFGPILLQNFAFMLLCWLLHLYNLYYSVVSGVKNNDASSASLMAFYSLHPVGTALVVW